MSSTKSGVIVVEHVEDDSDLYGYGGVDGQPQSLWGTMQSAYNGAKTDPLAGKCSQVVAMTFFWFTLMTSFYVMMAYCVPVNYADYDVMTRYYLKVAVCFVCVQIVANWLCARGYSSFLRRTRDVPHEQRRNESQKQQLLTGGSSLDPTGSSPTSRQPTRPEQTDSGPECDGRGDLPTGYCLKCQLTTPYRSHHCKICDRCVLKRDQHCYFTGSCCSYFNQRFFVVFAFYVLLGGLWTFAEVARYMHNHYTQNVESMWDFVIFWTLVRCLLGHVPFHQLLMMSQLYTLWWTSFVASAFYLWQLLLISQGKTTHEVLKKKAVRCTSSARENLRDVFGPLWAVNFLFPAILLFRQDGNGKVWRNVKLH